MNKFKFTTILSVILVCIFTIFSGCTYADNATLIKISNKYTSIVSKNDEMFSEELFLPQYNSENLNQAIKIYDTYASLKSNLYDDGDYEKNGAYVNLMNGVCISYTTYSNACSIVSNDKLVPKSYKKKMYNCLENLQEDIKSAKTNKKTLENIFNNIVGAQLNEKAHANETLYNLKRYQRSLDECLKDIYEFNNTYYEALINHIAPITSTDELIYGNIEKSEVTNLENSYLTIKAVLFITNYVINCSINLYDDILNESNLISLLADLLNAQANLSGEKTTEVVAYQKLRAQEEGLLATESSFMNACSLLNKTTVLKPKTTIQNNAKQNIQNYKENLMNYTNRLITYLESL